MTNSHNFLMRIKMSLYGNRGSELHRGKDFTSNTSLSTLNLLLYTQDQGLTPTTVHNQINYHNIYSMKLLREKIFMNCNPHCMKVFSMKFLAYHTILYDWLAFHESFLCKMLTPTKVFSLESFPPYGTVL